MKVFERPAEEEGLGDAVNPASIVSGVYSGLSIAREKVGFYLEPAIGYQSQRLILRTH